MADWIILAAISIVSGCFAVQWLLPRRAQRDFAFGLFSNTSLFDAVFLFDEERLISHSDIALAGFEHVRNWADLRRLLQRDFPTFPESPGAVRDKGYVVVSPIDCTVERDVLCEWIDGIVRVRLREAAKAKPAGSEAQNDPTRLAMDQAPYPVWLLGQNNRVQWCNAAYVTLVRKARDQDTDLTDPLFPSTPEERSVGKTRVSVEVSGSCNKLWFDLTQVEHASGHLCYAVDINAIVQAETAQRKFVQTMTKTFAQLSIGLAIFDRNRQLALFNPALIDLTTLPPDFLSCRPSLSSFFDRLRDQHMMPEPKNYRSWRRQMNDLLEAAEDGNYHETWSLPSGSVYSVSGRPHPDGAVAFLFEDITAEITLTRRFRSEMDLMQSILDKLADGIAVFADDGTLALTNYAYQKLWGDAEDAGFQTDTATDVTRRWQDLCLATPILGEIRDFLEMRDDRAEWTAEIHLRTGTPIQCTVTPLQNGATIVRFSISRIPSKIQQIEQISA
ncbi:MULTISPECIES: PAS-domain containing protein [unclassified Ruegeria]|uniref:PAS-domain containing protein n=1 Tax=unclassified Ruegeria TaxID=2625375 RepID=UPI001487BFD1|nr:MULTISPECIES: PAS-domain containing protein [unclassified Ruegeria]NOD89995.1 PAS domain-containing protein [Ruegeria sp. HKCCD4318]NOE15068.1 PAS domain-containing protein [Ruegeria sp. HKCCD4318-2]NOG10721.1 PAS domain-containing protein [Ruegeria sp. HKCCD4315]